MSLEPLRHPTPAILQVSCRMSKISLLFSLFRNEEAPHQYLCACVLMNNLRYTEELRFCARNCFRLFEITFALLSHRKQGAV